MNIEQLMKQAQAMQKKMQELEAQSEKQVFEAQAGGGLVQLKLDGKGVCKQLEINQSILNPSDKELLQDLLIAVFNDAHNKINNAKKDSYSNSFGGILPPGFKFPS